MDDPNITMEEYIRLEEEKARRGAIVLNDALTSEVSLSCEPTISPLNGNQTDFRISFDESDDEDYMVIYDQNLALSTYGSEAPVLRFCHGLIAVVSLRRLCHGTLREGDPRKAGGFDIWMSVCFVVLPEHFGFLTVEEASQILDGRHFFGPEVHGRTREARSGMYPILHDVGSDVREVVKEAPIAPGFGRVVDRLKEKEML
ncbi:hypothetical protein Tco_0575222 [Tanacetum coccineum]